MSDDLKVSGPIEIKDNSAEHVAFELMKLISDEENPSQGDDCAQKKASNRLYYLKLYSECISTVRYSQVPEYDSSLG